MENLSEFEATGRLWFRRLLTEHEIGLLAFHSDIGGSPGARLILSDELRPVLGPDSALSCHVVRFGVDHVPVRIVAFNKSNEANWGVPWHQDRVVAVKEFTDCAGYTNWLAKDGFWHCEPPLELLSRMLFVRIHIDGCDEFNGAMEVALGSHKLGFVPTSLARSAADSFPKEVCAADPGDVLVLKALTLHRSQAAVHARSRRALRVDYARRSDLDRQLGWAIAG